MLGVLGGGVPGEGAAVAGGDGDELVGLVHDLAGVDDLTEDIVEIGAVGAGEIGAKVAAGAVEHVAGRAGALEEGATAGGIGAGKLGVGEEALVVRDVGLLVGGGRGERAPEVNERGAEHARELAGVEGGDVAFRNGVLGERSEERPGGGLPT